VRTPTLAGECRVVDGETGEELGVVTSTEKENETAFDTLVEKQGWFEIHKQVKSATFDLMHFQTPKKFYRIDRVLVPTKKLCMEGWTDPIGVELKTTSQPLGPPLGQVFDYQHCTWNISPYYPQLGLSYIFLFPFEKQHGTVASVMSHTRTGTCCGGRNGFTFYSGEARILSVWDTGVDIGKLAFGAGKKTGSK
jgi:hypothetical protein